MKILATTKMNGPAKVLAPVIKELKHRGHTLTVYATGNENEAKAAFHVLEHTYMAELPLDAYDRLVRNYDLILTGLSGSQSSDGHFIRAARKYYIPSIGVLDRDGEYLMRFGNDINNVPDIITVPTKKCMDSMLSELPDKIGAFASKSSAVAGWAQFDNYSDLRKNFNEKTKAGLLNKLKIPPDEKLLVHFTQNQDPNSEYWRKISLPDEEKRTVFDYKMNVTRSVFTAASDLGRKLTVKPHPGEKYAVNHSKELADKHGFRFIPAEACNSQELMLAADSVTADKSFCLVEACLLGKNTAGFVPEISYKELRTFPALEYKAIPFADSWEQITELVSIITGPTAMQNNGLRELRKNFSVDGQASKRMGDIIEKLA